MNNIIEKICKYKYQIILFLIVIMIHTLLNINLKGPPQIAGYDEPSTIAWTGVLSGIQWSDVLAYNKYYGFGYMLVFGVFYHLTTDPTILYQIFLFFISIVYAISAILCMKIMCRIMKCQESICILLFSLACVFIPVKFVYVFNEHIYILLNWSIIYFFLKFIDSSDKNEKIKFLVCISLLLLYTATIHEKSLTIYISFFLTLFLFFLREHSYINLKKKIKIYLSMIIINSGFYVVLKKIIGFARKGIWNSSKVALDNTASGTFTTLINKILLWTNPINLMFPIVTFFSQLFFMSMTTAGIFLICFTLCTEFAVLYTFKKEFNNNEERMIFVISVYSLIAIIMTIVVQAITWMPNMSTIDASQFWYEILGKRAKLYLRYFCCYVGPLIMLLPVFINYYKEKVKKHFIIDIIIYFISGCLVMLFISQWYGAQLLKSTPIYSMFIPFAWWLGEDYLTRTVFLISISIALIIMLGLFMLFIKRKYTFMSLVLSVFLVYQYLCTGYTVYIDSSYQIHQDNYPVYEFFELNDLDEFTIYCPKMDKTYIRLKYYLTKYELIDQEPKWSKDKLIVIYKKNQEIEDTDNLKSFREFDLGNYRVFISEDISIQ